MNHVDSLLAAVLDAHGGLARWSQITKVTARLSIGGPIWAVKGWPNALDNETVEIETKQERSVFTPFTAADTRSIFEVDPERVTIESTDGRHLEQLVDARSAFKGFTRATKWAAVHLGYFIGYAFWNYLTTPFLFTYPGVEAREIEPWKESGQVWRRLKVTFPASIATHNPQRIFYFGDDFLQRRMDYVTEILGSTLVATTPRNINPSPASWYRPVAGSSTQSRRHIKSQPPVNHDRCRGSLRGLVHHRSLLTTRPHNKEGPGHDRRNQADRKPRGAAPRNPDARRLR
jgi:hypothetical protein